MVTENLLGHGGEERDGVGHGEAHLFCIFAFGLSNSNSRLSTQLDFWVVKFPHFPKEFPSLKGRGKGRGGLGMSFGWDSNCDSSHCFETVAF